MTERILELAVDLDPALDRAVDAAELEEVLNRALEHEGWRRPASVSLVLTDDAEIQRLNRDFRGEDRPTDVLSFSQLEGDEFPTPGEGGPTPLGDIVISRDRVKAQAEEYGHSERREVAYLAVHGLLHLLGHDHQTEEARRAMREREEAALGDISRG